MSNSATPSASIPKIHWGLNERSRGGGYFLWRLAGGQKIFNFVVLIK